MRILIVTAEVAPYAKTGGLGDVMGALPKAIHRQGHDVRVYAPLHGTINRKQYAFVPIGSKRTLTIGENFSTEFSFSASILSQEIPIYFFDSQELFGRHKKMYIMEAGNLPYFAFNSAVFDLLKTLDWVPDIIHCQDWSAALIPNLIAELPDDSRFKKIATLLTIHNSAFVAITNQWEIPVEKQDQVISPLPTERIDIDRLNFMKRGIRHASIITTVSEQYAKDLLTPERGHGLDKLLSERRRVFFGIRNGVDYGVWNPYFDQNLPVNYDFDLLHRKYDNKRALQHRLGLTIDDRVPILGMNTRITEQKGFSLLFEVFDEIMKLGVQTVVVGTGQGGYLKFLNKKMKQYPKQVAIKPYSEALGSLVYAGADIFLMPSLFEPSGLGQMISLRYGTIPVVRKTGGLADTITDYNTKTRGGNGFVFEDYTGEALLDAIKQALAVYHDQPRWWRLMYRGMRMSYSWEVPAKKYVRMYKAAVKEREGKPWQIPKKW